jgi:hypothetical protein
MDRTGWIKELERLQGKNVELTADEVPELISLLKDEDKGGDD